ncbi:MAG TPA: hypothetical protein VFY36_03540 [Solirubrobacteraceae bacterium]|nr:hypothetical protein [Solirubrobacteraceae bacterium]
MRHRELNTASIWRTVTLRGASAIRRVGISNSATATVALVGAITVMLVATGWAIVHGRIGTLVACAAVVGMCRLAATQRGAFVGILVLAAMNGIPTINTARYVSGHFTAQDLVICTLLVVGAAWALLDTTPYRLSRAGRIATGAAGLLLLWCLFTLARTIVIDHVPTVSALAFARDYVYFALLLLVLPRVRLTGHDIAILLITLTVGVSFFAVVQIAIALGFGNPGTLIHVGHILHQDGLTRVYSQMTDLVTAGLAISLAASLAAPQRVVRNAALPVALLLTTSVVVQLTRARWIGLIAAFVIVSAWLMLYSDNVAISAALRKRMVVIAVAVCVIAGAVLLALPGIFSDGPFIERLTSIFSDIESRGGTVAVREEVTKTMKSYLGGRWLEGLGFISPSVHYFQGLPSGSIEDPDLGVLNAIMPMGAVGAALIYLSPVLILLQCLRRASGPSDYAWLRYGGAMWLVATLVSSITLVTLFSTSGLTLAAVLLTILMHPLVVGKRAPTDARQTVRAFSLPAARG